MSIENRLKALEECAPQGYRTYDANGAVVIQSDLDGLSWYVWATNVIRGKGNPKQKALLISQLMRSEGQDNAGGSLYELILALAETPHEGAGPAC